MTLPLYEDHNAPENLPKTANRGLWFDKFFNKFNKEDNWKVGDKKSDWLKILTKSSVGDEKNLKKHARKQIQLVEKLAGQAIVFQTTYHFVSGMGNPHPVENGLSWHPTLGVPYLSGSAVKGLVRSWLETWDKEDDENKQKEKLLKWFGSTSKNPSDTDYAATAGDIIFFDALPVAPVQLKVDIMTPHMGKWYEQGGTIEDIVTEPEKIPADWHDPTPIPFLVAKEASFLFTIAPRTKKVNKDLISEVIEALTYSLDYLGAGAKTAVGYGQMIKDDNGLKKLKKIITREEKEPAEMSPAQRELSQLQEMFTKDVKGKIKQAGGATTQKLSNLIKAAESWNQEDKNRLADLGEKIYEHIGWGKKVKKNERKALLNRLREA